MNAVEKSREFQAWQAAQQKLSQVQEQISALKVKEDEMAAQLRSIATDPQDLTSRASAFLDGGIEAINHREHLAEQLQKLREQIEIVERAAEIQSRTVDRARSDYSALVCRERFRPQYVEAARKVIAGIEQLAAAFQAENALTDEIEAADVARTNIPTVRGPIVNQFLDAAWVHRYVEEIKKNYPEIA